MNLREYVVLSERTLSTNFYIGPRRKTNNLTKLWNYFGEKLGLVSQREKNLMHAAYGVADETIELFDAVQDHLESPTQETLAHLIEEMGDLCWYLAIVFREESYIPPVDENTHITEDNIPTDALFGLSRKILTLGGNFLAYNKKEVFYGKVGDFYGRTIQTQDLIGYVYHMCNVLGISFGNVLETNITKLIARYGEKFSSDKALIRDLGLEQKVLLAGAAKK